ncbi:MAG TPA: amidohydrolase, partial [Agrobacterium sp.]|nr:amidohydrolase [Agrobacterium sp.]
MTRLAASQYAIELIETWEAYTAHLSAVVREAKSEGA